MPSGKTSPWVGVCKLKEKQAKRKETFLGCVLLKRSTRLLGLLQKLVRR